jgi:LCP family protein required for cell wall assembly
MESPAIFSEKRGKTRGKIFLIATIVIFLSALLYGVFFSWKLYSVGKKINIENDNKYSYFDALQKIVSSTVSERISLAGENDGRINILLLGAAGENWPGENLTDTIMIASLDTKDKRVALLSLPRDMYVTIAGSDYSTKMNQIYEYGLQNGEGIIPVINTVEKVTGLTIHYFLVVDFEGFKKVVDDIGGINIMVEKDIYDPGYPGPNRSYETFEISKGLHHLNGEVALKYVRERHDREGDFGRARRQQQVLQAVKNRVFSLETFLNPLTLNNLLDTLGDNVKTNAALDEIEGFLALGREVDTQNITTEVVDAWKKESLLKVSHINTDEGAAFILVPRVGNWSEISDLAQNIFDLEKIKKRQNEIEKEESKIAIINQSEDKNLESKIRELLKDKLNMKDVNILYYQVKPYRNETIVIDNTEKQKIFTLDELLKVLPAGLGKASDDIMNLEEKYDIVIVLGNDLIERYSFEEANIEEFNKARDE